MLKTFSTRRSCERLVIETDRLAFVFSNADDGFKLGRSFTQDCFCVYEPDLEELRSKLGFRDLFSLPGHMRFMYRPAAMDYCTYYAPDCEIALGFGDWRLKIYPDNDMEEPELRLLVESIMRPVSETWLPDYFKEAEPVLKYKGRNA